MESFWIVLTFLFVVGVLGTVTFALFRMATAGRREMLSRH